ncbi:MAG: helix-turn-helix transcriptional regulator [Oscillospiraceae bacterium]|nr:helix-turn-helix transcriptional regulator [Oscillospiraceae bacterium]
MFHKDLFGTRLRKLRKKHKRSQQDIADLLGVKQNQICEMENGRTLTSFERLYILCDFFNVSADYFLGLTNDPRPLRDEGAAGASPHPTCGGSE